MNTLVPLEYYTPLYYTLLLIIVLWVFIQTNYLKLTDTANLRSKRVLGTVLFVFTVLYMGTRPISGKYFVDMRTYADSFSVYADGAEVTAGRDIYFEYFMKWCSNVMTVEYFFLLCALLYVFPMFVFSKRIFKEYSFYGLLILFSTLTFWASGVNGIRNGIATSLVLMAIAYHNNKLLMALIFIAAIGFHKSTLLIIAAYLFTAYFKNTNMLIKFWFFCIILSALFGGSFQAFFAGFGFGEDDRLNVYLAGEVHEAVADKIGFRWDFLLYSSTAVFAGYFYIIKHKFDDNLYKHIFHTFLITNSFWILVIRANYSNRFAYLSWFIMGIIIIYPLIKVQIVKNQHFVLGRILIVYFMFSYLLNVILNKA